MNAPISELHRFINARHNRRLLLTVFERIWLLTLAFMVVTTALNVIFVVFPWTILPLVWDIVACLFCAGIIAAPVDHLIVRRPDRISTARILEQSGGVNVDHPLLSIALELSDDAGKNEFHDEVFRRAAKQIETFRRVPIAGMHPRLILASAVLIFLTAVSFVMKPRLVSYWRLPFTVVKGAALRVYPGTVSVPRHASVTLRLVPQQSIAAPSCRLELTDLQRGKQSIRLLRPDNNGVFSMRIDSCSSSFSYRFTCGTFWHQPETVSVVPPPHLNRLLVELTPPAYTGIPSGKLPEGQGDFSAYSGSRARFTIESTPLRAAALIYDSDTVALNVRGTAAEGELMIGKSGMYGFSLIDTFLQKSDSIMLFSINVLPDEAPDARFLSPGANKNLEPAQRESLLVEAADDLGVRELQLYWQKSGERDVEPSREDLSPPVPVLLWRRPFLWNIARLSLYPGDTLFYWARARDTKTFGRPQYAATDTFWFRIPTFEEIHRSIVRREEYASESIGKVLQRQHELMRLTGQLDKATAGSKQPSWDQQQLARNIEQTMRAQADSLRMSLENLERNVDQLRKEGALGEEIIRKMDEVRAALEELIAMYGDTLLFSKDKTGEITLDELRRAVEKLNGLLPELSERLDNTLRFLEALKLDRELAQLALRAEKLAQEQLQLAQGSHDAQTASRQNDLLDRIGQLRNDIERGLHRAPDLTESPSMRQIDSIGIDMKQHLSRKQIPSAGSMRQMSANLASLAQQLRERTSSFMREQLEALRSKMLDLVNNSLNLSSWQESIRAQQRGGGEKLRELAATQQAIHEAVGYLELGIDSLPVLPPSIRRKLRADAAAAREAAKAAAQSLGESDGGYGMRMSERQIRNLAASLLDIVSSMDQQNGRSCNSAMAGLQESLRRMSGKQAAINAATAQLLRAMLEGRMPGGDTEGGDGHGNEAARKEAQAAQKALAEELRALGEKFGDASGEGMRERIKQLEEEARNLTRMLEQPREEVTERQDRFLARMLQAALSIHREEEGKEERKSTSARVVFTRTDGMLSDSALGNNDTFHLLRRRALQEGTYPASYRMSINAYFDSLGALYLK